MFDDQQKQSNPAVTPVKAVAPQVPSPKPIVAKAPVREPIPDVGVDSISTQKEIPVSESMEVRSASDLSPDSVPLSATQSVPAQSPHTPQTISHEGVEDIFADAQNDSKKEPVQPQKNDFTLPTLTPDFNTGEQTSLSTNDSAINEQKIDSINAQSSSDNRVIQQPKVNSENTKPAPHSILDSRTKTMPDPPKKGNALKIILAIVIAFIVIGGSAALAYLLIVQQATGNIVDSVPLDEDIIIDTQAPEVEEDIEVAEEPIEEEPVEEAIDTDGDGLTDDEEMKYGTDPLSHDSDNDGLGDREEVQMYGTDPLDPDTDKDTYLDGQEVAGGYNPNGEGQLFEIPKP